MNTESIIREIDSEIARLQQAREILAETFTRRGPGRPAKTASVQPKKLRRQLSAEARAKIAAAQRARWSKSRKKASPKGAKTGPS